MKRYGYKAWLVTWEWMGDYAAVPNRIAAILNPHWSEKRVSQFVEFLYATQQFTLRERLGLASGTWKNPYPVRWGQIGGVPWMGEMTCGDNPWLYARFVDDLRISRDSEGNETSLWTEREKPSMKRRMDGS